SHQRTNWARTHIVIAAATVIAVITAILRRTSAASCSIRCATGRILAATIPAPMISATAVTPGAWLRGLQYDGLPMTGCFLADSVKHATHLFLKCTGMVLVCWPGWRTVTPP